MLSMHAAAEAKKRENKLCRPRAPALVSCLRESLEPKLNSH